MKSFKIGDITIPVPVVQGGMGIGISLSGLASAVATAGGVGTIATVGAGLIYGSPGKSYKQNNIDIVTQEIRKARQLSTGILAVNIMSVLSDFSEMVETSIKEKIDIIFSGAGLPLNLPKYKISGSKTKLVPIVSSLRAARLIARKWVQNYNYVPDAFVVEGPEAGGHLGFNFEDLDNNKYCLEDLVKEIVPFAKELSTSHNKSIPVIAGGGITNGGEIRKIIELGASAVQMGSSFIATEECDASIEFKQKIIQSKQKDIRIIQSPVGMPGRAIDNEFLESANRGEKRPEKCKFNCIRSCNSKTTDYCIAEALLSAYHGKFKSGFAFTGANAFRIKSISTVAELINRLKTEYKRAGKIV